MHCVCGKKREYNPCVFIWIHIGPFKYQLTIFFCVVPFTLRIVVYATEVKNVEITTWFGESIEFHFVCVIPSKIIHIFRMLCMTRLFFRKNTTFSNTWRIRYFNVFDESNWIRWIKNGRKVNLVDSVLPVVKMVRIVRHLVVILAWENNQCFYWEFNIISAEKRVNLFQNRPWYPDNFVYNSIRTWKWYVLYQ